MRQIKSIIPKPFAPLVDPNVRKIVERSGRSSGKTTTNEIVAATAMLESKYNNIWYCRAETGDLRTKIFNSFINTINSLGVDDLFKIQLNPMQVICRKTGAICYFSGINGKTIDDVNATKGFMPRLGSLKMFIVDEANEVKASSHLTAAKATADKFLLPESKVVYALNPPPTRTHWSNAYFNQQIQDGAKLIYTTYKDVQKLLKPTTVEEIESLKRDNPRQFEYWYLGQQISLEGVVIWSFDRKKHLISISTLISRITANYFYQPQYMFYGVDSGLTSDATAISAWGLFPDGKLIKLSTFYFDIKAEKRKMNVKGISHTDQVQFIINWFAEFRQKMASIGVTIPGQERSRWCFDGAALTQDLMLEFGKATGLRNTAPITNKDIERDLARLINAYRSGQLEILDTPENEISVYEMENFVRDENNEIPEGQSDHTIDADKYATYDYYYNFI